MAGTTVTYPETDLTVSADLAPEISIDYTRRFATGIKKLQKLLGLSNLMPVSEGGTIKTYKYTSDIKAGNVAEGDYIPLSKVNKVVDQTYTLTLNKWRRNTTAESIQSKGRALAINDTDAQFVAGVQGLVRTDLFSAITSTTKTSDAGTNLQSALAKMWGALQVIFEDYDGMGDIDDESTSPFVFFVNPMDVANYLGTATITTESAFGMSYIKDFLGLGTTFTTAKVASGSIYGTAAQNLNVAYVPVSGGDLASTFGLSSDATGLVGITHSVATVNATIDTLLVSGIKVFPEISDAVLKGTITPATDAGRLG